MVAIKDILTILTLVFIFYYAYINRRSYVKGNREEAPLFEYVCDFRNAGVNYHIIKIPSGVSKCVKWAYYGVPEGEAPFNPFEPKKTLVFKNCYRCYDKDKWCPDNAWEPLYTIRVTNSAHGNAKEVIVTDASDTMRIYRVGKNGLPDWILY